MKNCEIQKEMGKKWSSSTGLATAECHHKAAKVDAAGLSAQICQLDLTEIRNNIPKIRTSIGVGRLQHMIIVDVCLLHYFALGALQHSYIVKGHYCPHSKEHCHLC